MALSPGTAKEWGYNKDSDLVLVLTAHVKLETYNVVGEYFIDIVTYYSDL